MRSSRLRWMRVGGAAALLLMAAPAACAPVHLPGGPWQTSVPGESADPALESQALPIGKCPWEPGGDDIPQASVDDPVAATEQVAMDETRFWAFIESIPDRPRERHFASAASALAGCGLADLVGFEARLTLALYALDGPDHLAWYEERDPTGFGYASDDTFLYARCATVLGGREAWTRAVGQGTLEWGDDPPDVTGISEFLLSVSWDAAAARGLGVEETLDLLAPIRISFESGSNTTLWDPAKRFQESA